jgi:predicted acylesterase/phospholipase RssA
LPDDSGPLRFRAGAGAYKDIKKRGFSEERIGTIAGASGGAKWLVLSQLDRVIIERVLPKLTGPVHLLGSSIGAWRFVCYAQSAPLAALERFEAAYVAQSYSARPGAAEVTRKSREILAEVLGERGATEIIEHSNLRSHIVTVRSRLLTASDYRPLLWSGLFAAALANTVHRRTLGAFFTRCLFYDPRDLPPFYNATGFPLERVTLTEDNLADAVIASGSIPTVLTGVRNIPGAPAGIYRDGGVIDYHLDLPLGEPDRLTLFPHFFDRLIPGWFDKSLAWRKHNPLHTDRTVVICPSAEFIARLPGSKVPDRADFVRMPEARRIEVWRSVVSACRALADDLNDVLDKDHLAARLEPL